MNRYSSTRTRRRTKEVSDALPVKPGVFEALDLVRQFAPVPHEFQISVSGFRVLCFLRCDVAFHRLYPKPFRSRRHQNQPGATRAVPSNFDAYGPTSKAKPIPTR